MGFGQGNVFGKRLKRREAATSGLDLEFAALRLAHDKVLQETSCCDIGLPPASG